LFPLHGWAPERLRGLYLPQIINGDQGIFQAAVWGSIAKRAPSERREIPRLTLVCRVGYRTVDESDRETGTWMEGRESAYVKYGTICYPASRYGPAPPIRGCSPACMGAADSSTAREIWVESAGFRKAAELLVDGDLSMGAGAAEAASGLPDWNGQDGWTAQGMVFLEDGGHHTQ